MKRFLLPFAMALISTSALAQAGFESGPPRPGSRAAADQQSDSEDRAKEAAKDQAAKQAAPPPAIPGAEPSGEVAPADRSVAEMSPNDALFDAINRGDMATARDAVSRGAQLEARNVLGQTPLDAAIDLNRNDITFLLLSLRGASASSLPQPKVARAAAAAPPHKGRRATVVSARSAVQKPSQMASDPGRPNAEMGFTGF